MLSRSVVLYEKRATVGIATVVISTPELHIGPLLVAIILHPLHNKVHLTPRMRLESRTVGHPVRGSKHIIRR